MRSCCRVWEKTCELLAACFLTAVLPATARQDTDLCQRSQPVMQASHSQSFAALADQNSQGDVFNKFGSQATKSSKNFLEAPIINSDVPWLSFC